MVRISGDRWVSRVQLDGFANDRSNPAAPTSSTSGFTVVAVNDLDALEETVAIASDASTMRTLARADAELARGEGEDEDALSTAMRARRSSE